MFPAARLSSTFQEIFMKLRPVLTVAAVGSLIAVGNTVPAYADDNQNVDDVNQVGVDNLAQSLVGENIEVTDYTYTGSNEAAGMFSGFGDSIGIDSGVLLSTGYADHPEGYGEAVLYGPNESGSRSEEHTSELQSRCHLVCRILLAK